MIRGTLALGALAVTFLVGDVFQRTVIQGLLILLPKNRAWILAVWQRFVARTLLGIVRVIGGARYGSIPRLPGEEGVLILMNHQSVLDIPLVVAALDGGYPRIVTRARYAKGKPIVSHMLRLYQYPLVGSGATIQADLDAIREAGRTSDGPLVIFPEGHRSRNGELRTFKRAGLRSLLEARSWRVYLLVADGFWRFATLKDLISTIPTVRGSVRASGPIPSPESDGEIEGFIKEMRERMVEMLREGRGEREP
jgi:1-acyl-sn-glycerol-3-phosphate acyltransferase